MSHENFTITKEDFEEFEKHFLISALKNGVEDRNYGFSFLCWFPEAGDYLVEYSNLGIPAGVYHPDDAAILGSTKSPSEARSFIFDRIEII